MRWAEERDVCWVHPPEEVLPSGEFLDVDIPVIKKKKCSTIENQKLDGSKEKIEKEN